MASHVKLSVNICTFALKKELTRLIVIVFHQT